MKIRLGKIIGDECQFPFKHRLFNVILVLGMIASFWSAIVNYVLYVDATLVISCVISGVILCGLYYLSVVKKVYTLSLCLGKVISIFFVIPLVWIYNGGSLGSVPLYIASFAPLGMVLASGFKGFLETASLVMVTNILLMLEYKYPSLIIGHAGDLNRYIEMSIGLTTTLVASSVLYVVILDLYNTEHEKVSNCLIQIEQQRKNIEFQNRLEIINERLQQEIFEREQAEKELQNRNLQLQHEISERIRAEQEIDSQRRQLETICQNSPDIIVRYAETAQITFMSSSAVKFGLHPQNLIGKDAAQIGHTEYSIEWWRQQFDGIVRTGKCAELELEMFLAGSKRFFYTQLVPEFDEGGEVIAILGFFRDVTTLKNTEKEMARLDRLNLVGQMAASIGHEIRNPMTTIRGFLQHFAKKREFTIYLEEFNIMINELDRANEIITEFLSLAKTKSVSLTASNLNIFIKTIYPLLAATALEKGHNIELELEEIEDLLLDEKEIRQLILNLVHNGFEAMKDRGTVTIKTHQEGEVIDFIIQDNGCGIPQEVLKQLGTPFVTTKEMGTGLGLPVCYRIVERHNAKMEVETGEQGTTFIIRFNVPESAKTAC